MRRLDRRAERTSWNRANGGVLIINAPNRTRRNAADLVELDVRRQVVGIVNRVARAFAALHGELIGSVVKLTKIIDAAIGLLSSSRL